MAIGDKLFELIKSSMILNERVQTLSEKVDRMDSDVKDINKRLVRIETLAELAQKSRLIEKTE